MARTLTRHSLLLSPLLALPAAAAGQATAPTPAPAAEWWRTEVCYELFVRSFRDSDGDGIGDLRGLIEKLDYINDGDPATDDDLGAGCVWLMPIVQATSYHGYDVTNYFAIDRAYGNEADFRELVAEAHRRGIRVLFDLVLNHTSSEHPYFRDALLNAESSYHDWYIWASEPREMPGWSAPTWHRNPHRDEYYFGLFWHTMPDLDLGRPEVKAFAADVARYWLEEMDVDGFRLDAVAHFFEEGGAWRHVPATHAWLREYAGVVRGIDSTAFTVGEVFDDYEATVPYYPDQLDSYFMLELGDAIIESVNTGSKARVVALIERIQAELPEGRYATLLRNHDQTRTLTDLGGSRDRARVAASILLTLPGIPFLYYGEEIGMSGSKADGDPRLRTPMHWALEPGVGFSEARPWEPLRPDSFTANVEAMDDDPASLLNHYRRLIRLRNAHPALARGDFLALESAGGTEAGGAGDPTAGTGAHGTPGATGVPATADGPALAYLRRIQGQIALVVVNLGDGVLEGVELAVPAGALPPGSYEAKPVLRGGAVGPEASGATEHLRLRVEPDGGFRGWSPVSSLEPYGSRLFLLKPES